MTSGDNLEWLEELLIEVQLEQFFHRITDDLQITRLVHFNYVHSEDLEKIGLARPAIRRLMEAVRKRRSMAWRQTLMEKILPGGRKKAPRASPSKAPPASTCLILEREISLADKLGDGSFGVVRRGEWRPGGGPAIAVAVKVLKADVSMPGVVEDFFKEVQSMHVLDHPNLIHLHGVVLSKPLMMVTELADRGSLLDTLHTRTLKHLSLMHIWRWAVEVATGMAYLETRRILHRDLACRNVFLHGPEERVKIGDFGLMRSLPQQEDCYVMTEHRRVPFPWCAPESLRLRQFSHASDAWMFGVTLWEMFTGGEEPWVALNGAQVLKKIESGERLAMPELSSPEIYQLMLQCWHRDPQERLSFIDIQKFLKSVRPVLVRSTVDYSENENFSTRSGDVIAIIDDRPQLNYVKGQNQRTFVIGALPRNVLEAVQHGERSHSPGVVTLRHSADEGQRVLRRRTFNSADCRRAEAAVANRKSCQSSFQNKKSTESHTKERSYIAAKQFSYNKLRNESNCVAGKKLKPVRPPQPKVEGRVEEGNLIDLSSPDAGEAEAVELRGKLNEMKSFSAECILDTPIEVGTEYIQQQNASEGHDENLPSPVYENSREIDHTSWQSVMMEAYEAAVRSQEHELDPFDTSHVPIPEVQQNSFDDNWDYIRQLDVSHTPTSEMGYFTPPERETPIKELTAPEVAQESIINEIVAPTEALTLQYSATSNATTNIYDKVDEGSLYQELYPNLPATYQNIPDAWNSPRVYPERVVEAQKLRPHRPAPSIPSSR
ncbi:activated Cdc42 kinase Ack [Lutzomyia longipalpis]|uniref:activated Cdc42 kinase Ack n=1 Tax=Lutzomyia longipalpis TaxID=7200 RepID=UPI0024840DA2|nr:activated Cdc42 kinase Ack [Lutzomyia longipalpis]